MAIIALNMSKLTLLQRLAKGQDIITKSTGNPNVPGNTAALAAFVALQAELDAANAAVEAHKQAGAPLMTVRDNVSERWMTGLHGLAGTTEAITDGDPALFETAGFDAKAEPTPPQPVGQVLNVRVFFTGMPGYSKVLWKRDSNAEAFVLERSPDPITENSWSNLGTVTEAQWKGNGTVPGEKCWFRVAAVNKLGQGPWSEPALRPVM